MLGLGLGLAWGPRAVAAPGPCPIDDCDRDNDGWDDCDLIGWEDADGDGFLDCDCDDDAVGINPDEDDPHYDGQNWDCNVGPDGTWNLGEYDQDGDGYASLNATPDDTGANGPSDCQDENADIHPGAEEDLEIGNVPRVDRDCDGFTDPVGHLVTRGGCDCERQQPAPLASSQTDSRSSALWIAGLGALAARGRRSGRRRERGRGCDRGRDPRSGGASERSAQ